MVPKCWVGPGNKGTLVWRDYLSSCTSSTPCFLFCPGRTRPVLFLLCCFNSVARCHVRFYVSLSGSSVVCGVLCGLLGEHDCAIWMKGIRLLHHHNIYNTSRRLCMTCSLTSTADFCWLVKTHSKMFYSSA